MRWINRPWALAALTILGLALTASCTRGETEASEPQAVEPQRHGGVLHIFEQAPLSLDPVQSLSVYESVPVRQLFDSLVDLRPDLAIMPSLASSWTIAPDNLVYTFDLRKGVRFHDGTPLTADDVVFSLTRAADSPYASFLSMVEKVEKLDSLTVRIRLSRPSLAFLETLSMDGMKIIPKKQFLAMGEEAFAREPVGTGPFKFGFWDEETLKLTRNDDYFVDAPFLDGLHIDFMDDDVTGSDITKRWFEGELDITDVPLLETTRFERDPGTRILRYPELSLAFIGLVHSSSPLDNRLLRQSIASAINRDRLTRDSEATRRSANGILPPGLHGYSPDAKGPTYNPVAARRMLADAGYPEGRGLRDLTILHSGISASAKLMLRRISENLADVGITLRAEKVGWNELNERIEEGRADLFLLAWVADLTDPDTFLRGLFHSESSANMFAYIDPEIDRLLDVGAQEKNPQNRSEQYRQLENRILNDVPIVPLFHTAACLGVRTRVHGLESSPLGIAAVPFERVWLSVEEDPS